MVNKLGPGTKPFLGKTSGKKAQGAIEYLLIIGAAILVVAIVILASSGAITNAKQTSATTNADATNSLQDLRIAGFGSFTLFGNTYLGNETILKGLTYAWDLNGSNGSLPDLVNGVSAVATNVDTDNLGVTGTAAKFNGTSSYITMQVPQLNNWNAQTVSFWVKINSTTNWTNSNLRLVEKGWSNEWSIVINHSAPFDQGRITVQQIGDWHPLFTTSTNYADNNWHHIVLTISQVGNSTTYDTNLFVDGSRTDTNRYSSGNFGSCSNKDCNIYIGALNNTPNTITPFTAFFRGSIDDVALWNRALTAAEIQTLYTKTPH